MKECLVTRLLGVADDSSLPYYNAVIIDLTLPRGSVGINLQPWDLATVSGKTNFEIMNPEETGAYFTVSGSTAVCLVMKSPGSCS